MSTNQDPDTSAPTRYEIQRLLDSAIQPFDPATQEELDAIASGIGRGRHASDPLAVPVIMNRDGVIIDGSQRLRALLQLGRKYILASDVRILHHVSREDSLEWCVRLQANRRHWDMEQKARAARALQAKNGWSQRRLAKVFGVSQPAISQWLRLPADATSPELTDYVEGEDGVVQDVSTKRRQRLTQRAKPHPWSDKGECFELVRKATGRALGAADYPQTLSELSPEEREAVQAIAQDMVAAGRSLLAALEAD